MRRQRSGTRSVAVLLAVVGLMASACASAQVSSSQGTPSSSASTGGGGGQAASATLTVGLPIDVSSLDPYNTADEISGGTVGKLIFDRLIWVTFDSSGKPVYQPNLATSWTQVDPTHWKLELRPGVKFSDGSPFTASDVKFTFDRYSNKNATTGNSWSIVDWYKSVQVDSPTEVTIETQYPMPDFPARLAYSPAMVSQTAITKANQVNAAQLTGAALVGTGPFEIAQYIKGEKLTLKRNPNYWGTAPKLESIVFEPIGDDQARVAALQSGSVDMILDVPTTSVAALQQDSQVQVTDTPSTRYTYIWLNTLKPPFNNPLVRQAANYAIDWQAMSKQLFDGQDKPADSPLAPSNFGYCPQQPYTYDPTKAKQLLAQAGVTTPINVTFWSPQHRYLQDSQISTAVQGYLNQAGFNVNLQLQEWGSLSSQIFAQQKQYLAGQISSPDYNMLLISWGSATLDADYALYPVFHSGQQYNLAYYKDPQVDQLLEAARTGSAQERQSDYCQAEKLIWQDAPQIFGHYEPQVVAWKKGLQGVTILPFEHYLLRDAYWGS